MAFNPFIGRSKTQLKLDLQYQQDNLAANKSITMNGVGETRKAEKINKSIESTIAQILRALNALDPVNYPIDQITRDRQTRVTFKPESFSPCGDPNQNVCP